VLIGFVGTAYLVVVLIIGYYLIIFDPRLHPFRRDGEEYKPLDDPNPVDDFFLNSFKSRVRPSAARLIALKKNGKLELFFNKVFAVTRRPPEHPERWLTIARRPSAV
jgi:hypothetical protein